MLNANQNPEQFTRHKIEALLIQAGWLIQNKSAINLAAAKGVAVREYQTNVGPADYILFVDKKPVGVIEAENEDGGLHLARHEEQAAGIVTRADSALISFDKIVDKISRTGYLRSRQEQPGTPPNRYNGCG